jgi:peptidoglycan/LPS O-acetylase OafA/YrhL
MVDGGQTREYFAALDGLRALAVLAVLVFHADLGVATGGFLGVSVFFTLSGFLITNLLMLEFVRTRRIDLRRFYERRVRRLLPGAHVCITAVLAMSALWAASQRRDLPGDAIAAVANVANWRFAFASHTYQDLFVGLPSPLAHFWSLAIEEQCYLLLPVVAAWALRRGGFRPLGVALSGMLALSIVATLFTSNTNLVYNGTHTRAAELLIGALTAVVVRHRWPSRRAAARMSAGGLAVLTVLVFVAHLGQAWLYRGGLVLVAVVSACTVAGLLADHRLSRVLALRPFTAVGRRSYGVYLFHWPIFLVLTPERVGFDGVLLLGVRIAATGVVTVLSYAVIEQPIRRRRLFVRRRTVGIVSGVVAVGLVVAAATVVPASAYTRTQQLLALGDSEIIDLVPEPLVASEAPVPAAGPPTVLVLGSDNGSVGPLRTNGFLVVDGTSPGCPAAGGVEMRLGNGVLVDVSKCEPSSVRWPRLMATVEPDVVVVALSDLDNALVRTAADWAMPAPNDEVGKARLLDAAEQSVRQSLAALTAGPVPVLYADQVGVARSGERLISRLALETSPPHPVFHNMMSLVDAVARAMLPETVGTARRVLVIGDSTSLDMAQALSNAGGGRVTVQWAGANGCPLVQPDAMRSASNAQWQGRTCPDYSVKLPPLVRSFRPDMVMVVLGPTELEEHRYVGDPNPHTAVDLAFVAAHDAAMRALLEAVPGVPVLVTDAPAVQVGAWSTPEMTDPARLAAWNAQVTRWGALYPQVSVLAYAAQLFGYESQHGVIRTDGVHPDVEPLTDLVRGWLVPSMVETAEPLPVVTFPIATTTAAPAPPRVLVIGDSTSLVAARALADGADGRVVVKWAGQEGCPFVPAVAARPASTSPWRELECNDVTFTLPVAIDEFHPDVVLLVLGAMELMEQKYPDVDTPQLPGTSMYREHHDRQLGSVMSILRAKGVRLIVADTPPLGVGSYSTFEMADPARAKAFNEMVAAWDRAAADVSLLSYGQFITAYEAAHGGIRPDGSHPELGPLTEIARSELVPELVAALGRG